PAAPAAPKAPSPVTPRRNLDEYTPRMNAPGTKVIFRTPNNKPERTGAPKDELLDEFASRRLKIVSVAPVAAPKSTEGPAGPRPTYRTPGGPVGGVERKRTPGGPTPAGDMFQPMTSYVNKGDDEKNKRGGGGPNSGSTRGPTPEEIRVSDFRKRELVFQPKRKRLPPGKQVKRTEITEMAAHKKKVRIEDKIVVSELAQRMGEKGRDVVNKLVKMGTMVGLNQSIDYDTASLLAAEFGWEVENVAFNEADMLSGDDAVDEAGMVLRPPVITVMGHVDHGKTSLLDAIRNAKVASGEAGGITQHIGAYSVEVNGKPITFLDTPGHEAFANMRSRGANLTDIVVLVVAADDSIMPQTREAIAHAQKAGVPMIVAANKIDKPSANLEKVRKDLSINNVLVESWGGEVPMVGVSALTKEGIDTLLETIQLQAEVLDLQANPDRAAEGVILEARMEKGRGIVADLLVDKGTLRTGDFVVVGTAFGRVRAMMNDRGKTITEVLPGFPAEIYGLNDVPSAGDTFNVVKTESEAKEISENRRKKIMDEKAAASAPKMMTMDEILAKRDTGGVKELNLIVKADVYGSAEAIKQSIEKIQSTKVRAKVMQSGVGVVTENDVLMARTANAMILGFNSKPDNKARDVAKREKVEIKFYSIIYQLLDDVRAAMENLLEPLRKETPMGKAEVKQVFTVSKLGTVAGSMVSDGKITRNAFARVTRGKDTVAEGKVVSLKRFKDDVSETIKGQECGIGVEGFDNYLAGDIINVFHVELVKQTL
ncbi:MAG: translation initiation factor IF-2, partial [Proteobacteria bacterium]